jgi:dolichol kinase
MEGMTPQAWLGLALGVVIGTAYGALQRWGLGRGPRPDAVGRSLAGTAARLLTLLVAVFVVLRFTHADRRFLVVGIMVSYGLMFAVTMWKVVWKHNGKS